MMMEKIQNAGTVVVEAKAGKGSATLSMVSAVAGVWRAVGLLHNQAWDMMLLTVY